MQKPLLVLLHLLIAFLITLNSFGQNISCNHSEVAKQLEKVNNKSPEDNSQFENAWQTYYQSPAFSNRSSRQAVTIIPIVVHVIHQNGSENIADSIIIDQINLLNDCFRKHQGTIGDGNGVDTEIEFRLATIDPNGNPTNGITHTYSTYTGASATNVIQWPYPSRYLNIYVVKNIGSNASGFASPAWQVSVQYNYIGRNNAFGGRILVHEMGHWLNLQHTFAGGCNGNSSLCLILGDGVCDTPPVAAETHGCPTGNNTCSTDNPDLPDQIENYMDYTQCCNMFTQGQKERMHAFKDWQYTSLFSDENVNLSCNPCNNSSCPPIANFNITQNSSNDTGLSVYTAYDVLPYRHYVYYNDSITFKNTSFNCQNNYWTFENGSPSSSTQTNANVKYTTVGNYDLKFIANNPNGSDTIFLNDYIHVEDVKWGAIKNFQAPISSNIIRAMTIYKDELYASGFRETVNNLYTNPVVKFNDTNWVSIMNGRISKNGVFNCLTTHKDELIGAGQFDTIDGKRMVNLARYNGTSWNALDTVSVSNINTMISFKNELYVSGDFPKVGNKTNVKIAKWTGSNWAEAGEIYNQIGSFAAFNNELYLGGSFSLTPTQTTRMLVAKFDSTQWIDMSKNITLGSGYVQNIFEYKNELYIIGDFKLNGSNDKVYSAKYDGTSWQPFIDEMVSSDPTVEPRITSYCIANNELFVAGRFKSIHGEEAFSIAKWDGTKWNSFTSGTIDEANMLYFYKGSLFAGGVYFIGGHLTHGAAECKGLPTGTGYFEINKTVSKNIKIKPNPIVLRADVEFYTNDNTNFTLELFDLNGIQRKRICSGKSDGNKKHQIKIDCSEIPSGIYILKLIQGSTIESEKIIILH